MVLTQNSYIGIKKFLFFLIIYAKNAQLNDISDKVQRIFQMSVSGLEPTQVAKKLRSEGVLPPASICKASV